jgi:hypothetical protein
MLQSACGCHRSSSPAFDAEVVGIERRFDIAFIRVDAEAAAADVDETEAVAFVIVVDSGTLLLLLLLLLVVVLLLSMEADGDDMGGGLVSRKGSVAVSSLATVASIIDIIFVDS